MNFKDKNILEKKNMPQLHYLKALNYNNSEVYIYYLYFFCFMLYSVSEKDEGYSLKGLMVSFKMILAMLEF